MAWRTGARVSYRSRGDAGEHGGAVGGDSGVSGGHGGVAVHVDVAVIGAGPAGIAAAARAAEAGRTVAAAR